MKKRGLILVVIILLIISIGAFSFLNGLKFRENDVMYINDSLNFSSLSLKQKIAQMIIVSAKDKSDVRAYTQLNIGGIFIDDLNSKKEYNEISSYFIEKSKIVPFITTDMEGYWNPFNEFYSSKNFGQIQTKEQAYQLGLEHGEILLENGFNMDFSPVIDLEGEIWKGRAFSSDEKDVADKSIAYLKGLNKKGIFVIAKHYPGQTLVENSHDQIVYANITKKDLFPFNELIKENISGIMLNHLIVSGEINSQGRPISISKEVISNLRNKFNGLIITDEINMRGLKDYYCSEIEDCRNITQMYIDLFNSGNDIILNFVEDNNDIFLMISIVEEAVIKGDISEEKIDNSVKRILLAKGYHII